MDSNPRSPEEENDAFRDHPDRPPLLQGVCHRGVNIPRYDPSVSDLICGYRVIDMEANWPTMEEEMSPSLTFRKMNKHHNLFWAEQNTLREQRMKDDAVREAALGRLFDEQKRNVPVRNQATIEYLLAVAEAEKRRFLSQHARKGGQAKKTDALQQEIVKLVRRDPAITEARLKDMLTSDRFSELIVEFDEETISFQPGDSKHGRLKEARISGLKDRLSRAKKSLKSR